MRKARVIGFILLFLIVGIAASVYYYNRPAESSRIHISTNPWIGFTPFIYAQEKGWLESTPFRFLWLVDLTDNARLYERGFTQGFTATQYELLHFKNKNTIKPVFLIDQSFGADAIVSNRTLEELQNTREKVDVYLEQGSLNDDFFEAFVTEKGLQKVTFQKIDTSQKNISTLTEMSHPIIIISYQPYLAGLIKKGFKVLVSTQSMQTFFVVDALFVDEKTIQGREKEFADLKKLFALGVERFKRDPHEYYETIKGYLEGQSYEEFMETTTQIKWLYQTHPNEIITHLNAQQIKTDRLLP
ncbi:putative lipoprotein [Sulfuricurvum kujiense DSM 16994]|uniref:Lipoprotein n=1 Tax=Sulfuricurvum kujiense (strain ATCC BAA-921 / DSM 16994 / JCM 11577 / YK-1) TaxID=709032 RepID=E4TWV7_SULKY|nr:lipoprotein [Sulfuricurvum kujiense]ADR32788.1 putative lipoprotein [Sulfuricurvum kujiense DSM 16994]